jgi:prepilin-type N-terminal cleavage/methylation domain-containing protein
MRPRRHALTLLELLVVVAIMAVVAGMMLTTAHAIWKLVRGWQGT